MKNNIRIEVKWRRGRFVAFGKPARADMTAIESAIDYMENISRADFVLVPGVERRKAVNAMLFTREQVINALYKFAASGEVVHGCLAIDENQVKLSKVEFLTVIHTFGKPAAILPTGLQKVKDLQPDAGCPNAPYARAWEKVGAAAVNGKWVGALRGVQVDIIINPLDD